MLKNILEIVYMQQILKNKNGGFLDDLLPGLKKVDPTIESIEIFINSVNRAYIDNKFK